MLYVLLGIGIAGHTHIHHLLTLRIDVRNNRLGTYIDVILLWHPLAASHFLEFRPVFKTAMREKRSRIITRHGFSVEIPVPNARQMTFQVFFLKLAFGLNAGSYRFTIPNLDKPEPKRRTQRYAEF